MTPRELGAFWALEKKAWARCAQAMGIRSNDASEHEAWRHEQIHQATGGKTQSVKGVTTALLLGKVMLHFATLANDDREVEKWTSEPERRNAWVIGQKLALLSWATGIDHDWNYARGIFVQMRLPDTVLDCPADLAQKVMMAVDTQFRRYCADAGIRPADAERAKALGAPWISDKMDRDFHPLWQEACAANRDRQERPRFDHHATPQKRHADHAQKNALQPA